MTSRVKFRLIPVLLLLVLAVGLVSSRPHWLPRHGSVSCNGSTVPSASVYRSQRGDIFVYGADIQAVIISPLDGQLGRCNASAFTPIFGLLFSREAEPDTQCTSMWKGAGSEDREPAHTVTAKYAEFPWGSCAKLRVDY
jgi:hypothetical protein